MSRIEKWRWSTRRCSAGFVELLSPHIDGELDTGARLAVEAHLESCAACRTQHETLRFAARAVALLQIPTSEAPERIRGAQLHRPPFVEADSRRSFAVVAPLFSRILNAKISLPVPVAAALVMLVAAVLFLARPPAPLMPAPPNTIVETVEVPVERETVREVVRERLRTRIVYVEREKPMIASKSARPAQMKRERPRVDPMPADDALRIETARRSSLEGFRPATDANLRVVADEDK